MGLARYITFKAINAVIILFIVVLIISYLFNDMNEKMAIGEIQEIVASKLQQMGARLANLTEKEIEQLRETLFKRELEKRGLLEPLPIRVLRYAWKTFTFNFDPATRGKYSIFTGTETDDTRLIVLLAMANTAMLFTTAELIALAIGIFLGLQAARKIGSILDRGISLIAMLSASLPMWWVGILMIYIFSYVIPIFPSVAREHVPEEVLADPFKYFVWTIHHLTLPLITIVLVSFGGIAWISRNIVIGVMQEDFVTTARAKGVPERKVVYGHVLRAASPPIVTMSAFGTIGSFFGAIISETVFQWPGMGQLYWTAINVNDTAVVMAVTYASVFLIILVKFSLDLIYGILDPRVKTKW